MAASVNKQVEKRLAEIKEESETVYDNPLHDEARAYIMSLIEEKKPAVAKTRQVTLKSILAQAKNLEE
jgi:hypothetical protein